MGPTWVLSAPGRPPVGPMNPVIRDNMVFLMLQPVTRYTGVRTVRMTARAVPVCCHVTLWTDVSSVQMAGPGDTIVLITSMSVMRLQTFVVLVELV